MAKLNAPHQSTTIHDISDDLLEVILLHIPSTAGVIRAAATCKLWRRVIGGAGFLRRLNGPHILGHYPYRHGCRPNFFPFPSPAGEIAVDDIRDRVSLHFLPSSYSIPMNPTLHDSRRGLLAFNRGFSVIVYSPWTRQHRELYHPTLIPNSHIQFLGIFLLDDADEMGRDMNMSSFRVLCVRLIRYCSDDRKTVDASVFSTRDNRWLQLGTMAVGEIVPGGIFSAPFVLVLVLVGRVGGSICWSNPIANVVLHLDESTGQFSCFTLPGHAGVNIYYDRLNLRVMGGNTGSVHLVRIAGDDLEVLCYDRGSGACAVERKVRASQVATTIDEQFRRRWYLSDSAVEAAAPGCIVLCDNQCDVEYVGMFSVDTRNIELERVRKLSRHGGQVMFPYELPWTISVCL